MAHEARAWPGAERIDLCGAVPWIMKTDVFVPAHARKVFRMIRKGIWTHCGLSHDGVGSAHSVDGIANNGRANSARRINGSG
jgi:hypothetical protein